MLCDDLHFRKQSSSDHPVFSELVTRGCPGHCRFSQTILAVQKRPYLRKSVIYTPLPSVQCAGGSDMVGTQHSNYNVDYMQGDQRKRHGPYKLQIFPFELVEASFAPR